MLGRVIIGGAWGAVALHQLSNGNQTFGAILGVIALFFFFGDHRGL